MFSLVIHAGDEVSKIAEKMKNKKKMIFFPVI